MTLKDQAVLINADDKPEHIKIALGLGNCADDPMWAHHSEVSKALLQKGKDAIFRLHAENESLKSELSKWMLLSDEAKKGLESRAQLIAAQHANESLSAVNRQMLKVLRKVLVAGRGTSGRIILEKEHEELINAAIVAAKGKVG